MSKQLIHAVALALGSAAFGVLAQAPAAPAPAAKPNIPQVCKTCHTVEANEIRGVFENIAFKSKSMQIKIDNATEIVRFDEATIKVLDGGEAKPGSALRDTAKNREARVELTEKDGVRTATLISFKGPIKIAPEKLITYPDVAKLVDIGPEEGNFALIDSRPLPRFQEGTIPGAINLPYPAFDKFVDRLPADKSKLVVFFCQGITCTMSPKSLQRAEAMGYTNARVYREGVPEWQTRSYAVLSPAFLKEAWVDKDIPHVLVDARPAAAAKSGFIPGAVSLPADRVKGALAGFPDKKLKAPIIVYDENGGEAAKGAARTLVGSGQTNVLVVSGGVAGWKAAGYPVASGQPLTKVAYVPKPRPGEVSIAEFTKLAKGTPSDVLILDVRNPDEAAGGVIKGSMLIPDEDLAARIGEVPKDKRILTHCLTGVRAEMAYHKLEAAGYNAGFLNAEIAVDKNGNFKITPK